MYYIRGEKDGLPVYATVRGTSVLECCHRWVRAILSGSGLSLNLYCATLTYFNFRWNVRSGIRSRRANCDIFPGLIAAVTRNAAAAKGIDVDSNGLNHPPSGAMLAEGDDSFSSSNGDTNEPANSDSSETDSLAVGYEISATQRSLNGVEFPLKPPKCLVQHHSS